MGDERLGPGAEEGAKGCPAARVPRLESERWDFFEICSWFDCAECVAEPADLGLPGDVELREELPEADCGEDIPF